ncbi:hypothetical protein HMPREF7215_1834 [Pyramidobacter piscolens W5455]|uniref:Uncharacterized protein n=1 Tax=Pyramidobacter piscolens W5455 TaxID=352165 RepID=A0ABP2HRX6_9BACT|nr:hypothetical protein HMPREF7215_1834 [Pyramidobacter piscolens W5455]
MVDGRVQFQQSRTKTTTTQPVPPQRSTGCVVRFTLALLISPEVNCNQKRNNNQSFKDRTESLFVFPAQSILFFELALRFNVDISRNHLHVFRKLNT